MDFKIFLRRIIIFAVALVIACIYLFVNFKGLTTADGMEKAQLAREISRGKYRTKVIRPVSIAQQKIAKQRDVSLDEVAASDTYNSPLYPLVLGVTFKLIKGNDFQTWKIKEGEYVYGLDRVIAGLSMVFFLIAVFMAMLLAKEIFDYAVSGMTAIVLLSCEMFWEYTQTGLPNCMMLMLFMCAMFFVYKATEQSMAKDGNGFVFGALAGLFLVLLCMCHWIALWLLIGFIVYSFFIKPLGSVAGATVVFALIAFALPVVKNMGQTGNPFGAAFYTLYGGLGIETDVIMRSGDVGDLPIIYLFKQLPLKIVTNSFRQISQVYEGVGLIIVAPIFFISLLHKFKKASINRFAWAILSIWGGAGLGMSIYGIGDDPTHSNHLHYLFAPVMAMYGIAMVSVLWGRMRSTNSTVDLYKDTHLLIIGVISVVPILLTMPANFRLMGRDRSYPNWPPYFPSAMSSILHEVADSETYVMSDQPWAVAWYADRKSIWIPNDTTTFTQIKDDAEKQDTPISGVHISPISISDMPNYKAYSQNNEMTALGIYGWVYLLTEAKINITELTKRSPATAKLMREFPHSVNMVGSLMTYHSATPIDLDKTQ